MIKYIWIKNQRYYLYDTFENAEKALRIAKYYKKKNKSQYQIIKYEEKWNPEPRYALYLTRVVSLW